MPASLVEEGAWRRGGEVPKTLNELIEGGKRNPAKARR
jgi:hypothetical protein